MKRPHAGVRKANLSAPATLGVTEFKTHCLELIQAVHDRHVSEITVTKRGKALARVIPAGDEPSEIYGCLRELIVSIGDVTSPIDVEWDAEKR